MTFKIAGKDYRISRHDIIDVTRNVSPKASDGRNKHYVELHGRAYPIKQPIHLVTGQPYIAFTAQHAHSVLTTLDFGIFQINNGNVSPNRPDEGSETVKLAVVLESDEDGYIVASCPSLLGCHSQGRTKEEAISNIREAIRGYIASMRKHGEPLPDILGVEEVEVPV